jgi:DNA polymerase III delta prime subunit
MSRPNLPGDIANIIRQHLGAIVREDFRPDPQDVQEHLRDRLLAAEMPPEMVAAIEEAFQDFTRRVSDARAEYADMQGQLDRVRASSARRLGRVTRVMAEVIGGEEVVGIWIDDAYFIVLPHDTAAPAIGQTVQFALGNDGDAAYFGAYGYDHAGLVSARLKAVQPAGEGRTLLELELREGMAAEDSVVAIASAELEPLLAELTTGDRVRVTDGKVRIAYPAPRTDEAAAVKHNPLFHEFTPMSAEADNFVYSPTVLQDINRILKVVRDPVAAAESGIEMPQSVLLAGPSGTGKTTIVERYMARELAALGFQTIRINTSNVTSHWYGESEKIMREALTAGGGRNTFIIMNEVDAVMRKRGGLIDSTSADVDSRVFAAISDILGRDPEPGDPIRLLAFTTNYQARLDAALLSRISETVQVGLPDRDTAMRIMVAHLSRLKLDETPEAIAEAAIYGLDFPLVRLVFDSSEHGRVYQAAETLSGRTIQLSVQAAARAAYNDDTRLSAFGLARELRRQLHANLAHLGPEDLGVALGLAGEDAARVTGLHVDREALLETDSSRETRMRIRNAS